MAIDWKGVRQDYTSGGIGAKELAEKYKCHPDTIRRKARLEKWRSGAGQDESKGALSILPAAEDVGSGTTVDHGELWNEVRARLAKGLKSRDSKQGLEELKVAKTAVEVFTKVIEGERQAWGGEGDREEALDETRKITGAMASLTVPRGADEALDGGQEVRSSHGGQKER